MKSRFKTFSEFINAIHIVNRNNGGVKIICNLKSFVIVEVPHPLWNSKQTKKSFLVKLYIDHVLKKINLSNKITRIDGYELLGKRFGYRGDTCIICDSVEVVDKSTGEINDRLLLRNITNPFRLSPFFILKTQVQL